MEQDFKEASRWYTLSAQQGLADAQNNLGILYERGLGVPQDFKEAFKWFSAAARQGYFAAQNNLGTLYDRGLGVRQDWKKAFELYSLLRRRDMGWPRATSERCMRRKEEFGRI